MTDILSGQKFLSLLIRALDEFPRSPTVSHGSFLCLIIILQLSFACNPSTSNY